LDVDSLIAMISYAISPVFGYTLALLGAFFIIVIIRDFVLPATGE
jgi:hypothetical protein